MDDYLCQYNINTQQIIYTKFDQPGLKTRILARIWMLVNNFLFTILSRPAIFPRCLLLLIRVTGFCCCYVSTPSLVMLSDGANFLGLDSLTNLHQQIKIFRSHMAGRDGSEANFENNCFYHFRSQSRPFKYQTRIHANQPVFEYQKLTEVQLSSFYDRYLALSTCKYQKISFI